MLGRRRQVLLHDQVPASGDCSAIIFFFHGPIRLASLKTASWTEHLLIGDFAWPHRQSADFGGEANPAETPHQVFEGDILLVLRTRRFVGPERIPDGVTLSNYKPHPKMLQITVRSSQSNRLSFDRPRNSICSLDRNSLPPIPFMHSLPMGIR